MASHGQFLALEEQVENLEARINDLERLLDNRLAAIEMRLLNLAPPKRRGRPPKIHVEGEENVASRAPAQD